MRIAAVNTSKSISSKSYEADIIGRTMREVTSVISKIEKKSAKVALAVNGDKTKLMVLTSGASTRLDQSVNADNSYNLKVAAEFICLGSA